jgi:hypothetical protein
MAVVMDMNQTMMKSMKNKSGYNNYKKYSSLLNKILYTKIMSSNIRATALNEG